MVQMKFGKEGTHRCSLVTVSFSDISTVKTIYDQRVYTHFCTHFPHLLSDGKTFGIKDMHKMSSAREAVIFQQA